MEEAAGSGGRERGRAVGWQVPRPRGGDGLGGEGGAVRKPDTPLPQRAGPGCPRWDSGAEWVGRGPCHCHLQVTETMTKRGTEEKRPRQLTPRGVHSGVSTASLDLHAGGVADSGKSFPATWRSRVEVTMGGGDESRPPVLSSCSCQRHTQHVPSANGRGPAFPGTWPWVS